MPVCMAARMAADFTATKIEARQVEETKIGPTKIKIMEQAKEKLRAFLARHIGGRAIGDEEQIFASGFVNSMFAMQIVLFLEKNFQIAIADEDLELKNFQTINAMAALIEKKTDRPRTIRTA